MRGRPCEGGARLWEMDHSQGIIISRDLARPCVAVSCVAKGWHVGNAREAARSRGAGVSPHAPGFSRG